MGYAVGPQYAESSNIDNAGKLQGYLMLVVGEMDENVPPESTYRFVDALIRAGKDFDLLVVPNGGARTRRFHCPRSVLKPFFPPPIAAGTPTYNPPPPLIPLCWPPCYGDPSK